MYFNTVWKNWTKKFRHTPSLFGQVILPQAKKEMEDF